MNILNIKTDSKPGIYKITNIINNEIYIGSSKSMYMRGARHRADLNHKNHQNQYLQNSVNKNGLNNFKIEVVEYCNEEELLIKEQYYINTLNPKYNLIKDVVRQTLSEESRLKISKSLLEAYKNGTKKPSPQDSNYKPVDCYDIQGIYIRSFKSMKQAADFINVSPQTIYASCVSNIYIAGNFVWRFKGNSFNFIPYLTVIDKEGISRNFTSYKEAEKYYGFYKGFLAKKIYKNIYSYGNYKFILRKCKKEKIYKKKLLSV